MRGAALLRLLLPPLLGTVGERSRWQQQFWQGRLRTHRLELRGKFFLLTVCRIQTFGEDLVMDAMQGRRSLYLIGILRQGVFRREMRGELGTVIHLKKLQHMLPA